MSSEYLTVKMFMPFVVISVLTLISACDSFHYHNEGVAEMEERIMKGIQNLATAMCVAVSNAETENKFASLLGNYSVVWQQKTRIEEIANKTLQELSNERLISSQVREEKALLLKDQAACEAQSALLRQEKENLLLKVKEEESKNAIMSQEKDTLVKAAEEARSLEKAAREEIKLLVKSIDELSSQRREFNQTWFDEMEKAKLAGCQEHTNMLKLTSQVEFEKKEGAMAESAATKIKGIVDKHQMEIMSLKEKHSEEMRLVEIRLAQESQKALTLEEQLKSQRADEKQLAEQIQSSMQKQCLQAIKIIAGADVGAEYNISTLQRSNIY